MVSASFPVRVRTWPLSSSLALLELRPASPRARPPARRSARAWPAPGRASRPRRSPAARCAWASSRSSAAARASRSASRSVICLPRCSSSSLRFSPAVSAPNRRCSSPWTCAALRASASSFSRVRRATSASARSARPSPFCARASSDCTVASRSPLVSASVRSSSAMLRAFSASWVSRSGGGPFQCGPGLGQIALGGLRPPGHGGQAAGERLLLDLELQRGDPERALQALGLGLPALHGPAGLAELLLAGRELAADMVEVLLLRGHHLDEVLLGGELLQQQVVDGRAVLPLLLEHRHLGLVEAPEQVVDLHLQPLQLDVLLVQPVLDAQQLALADGPDLRDARQLRLAQLQLVAEDSDLPLRGAHRLAARRRPAELLRLGEQLGLAVGDGGEGAVEEGAVLLGEGAAALATGQPGRAARGRRPERRRHRHLPGGGGVALAGQRLVERAVHVVAQGAGRGGCRGSSGPARPSRRGW